MMITTCFLSRNRRSCCGKIRDVVLLPTTHQENLGEAERREETPAYSIVLPTSQNPSRWNPSWLRDACASRKDPKSDQIWAKQDDWPDTTWKLTLLP